MRGVLWSQVETSVYGSIQGLNRKVQTDTNFDDKKNRFGHSVDADYHDKNPIDPRPILNTRINGGRASPAKWDPISHGYVGTNRMRISDDIGGRADEDGIKTAVG